MYIYMRGLLWRCFIVSFSISFSCHQRREINTSDNPIVKFIAPVHTAKDSFIRPKVIPITTSNQPKVQLSGKPVTKIVLPADGAPFFTNYGVDQGLLFSSVLSSACDKMGNLWFGTGGGGVYRYDGKNFTGFTTANGLVGNVVLAIIADKEGILWFGTTAGVT